MSRALFDKTATTSTSNFPSFSPEGILNFRSINTPIEGRIGYKGSEEKTSLPYVAKKPGGSDVGHVITMNSAPYMIKTGITLSLLEQALKKFTEGKADKERMYLSFIVGNFTRIAGAKPEDHVELSKALAEKTGTEVTKQNFADLLTQEMLNTLNAFKATDAGKALLEKLKSEPLTSNDVYNIYNVFTQNPLLKDVIGLSAFADLVSGAYGQFFSNNYQARSIPKELLDDHRLLIEGNNNPRMYMASRLISQAQPFEKFLLESFLNNDPKSFANKEEWLAKCKQDLSAKLFNLKGLGSAILIRHIMGESADLGPDNMLIVTHNNTQHVINIDVTGFRYPRRAAFKDERKNEVRLGWEDTLKHNNVDALLDSTVFSSRFIWNNASIQKDDKIVVMKAIVEVLVNKAEMASELQDVKEWLQTQKADLAVNSLHAAMDEAYKRFDNQLKPQALYLEKLKTHTGNFIHDSINVARQLKDTQLDNVQALCL